MSFVYWLYEDGPRNFPYNSGYIGVSEHPTRRWQALRKSKVATQTAKLLILYEGSQEECLRLEHQFRPHNNIGWNTACGGGGADITLASKTFIDMLGVFAEFETNLRKERQ